VKHKLLLIIILLALYRLVNAQTPDPLEVPSEYGTIQQAVTVARPGDIILIDDGYYFESINLSGKNNITLKGKNGKDNCYITGGTISGDSSTHNIIIEDMTLENSYSLIDFSSGEHDITIRNCNLYDCYYNILLNNASNILIENCSIHSAGQNGIVIQSSSGIKINNCQIYDISMAMTINYNSDVIINKSDFYNISFQAIYSRNSVVIINSNTFTGMQYCLQFYETQESIIKNCKFKNIRNSIYLSRSTVAITNIRITGGERGIWCMNNSFPTIVNSIIKACSYAGIEYIACSDGVNKSKIINCIITGNQYYGILGDGSDVDIINCTLSKSHQRGAIMFYWYSDIAIKNCIIAYNNIGIDLGNRVNFNLSNLCLWNNNTDYAGSANNSDCNNCIYSDPYFEEYWNDNYHLRDISPCIDTGTSIGAPDFDFNKTERPYGAEIDIGAYEYAPSSWDEDEGEVVIDTIKPEITYISVSNNTIGTQLPFHIRGTYLELHINKIMITNETTGATIQADIDKINEEFLAKKITLDNMITNRIKVIVCDLAGNYKTNKINFYVDLKRVIQTVSLTQESTIHLKELTINIPEGTIPCETNTFVVEIAKKQETPPSFNQLSHIYTIRPDEEGSSFCFMSNIIVSVEYNEALLARGFREENIRMFVREKGESKWNMLKLVSINTQSNIIRAEVPCLSDFGAGIMSMPSSPEPLGNNITGLGGLQGAHPLSGIVKVNPPIGNNMGSAGLSYPIAIPPGRAGIQPNLALTYNSDNKNGLCGMGWDLPLNYIGRSTKNGIPKYTMNDIFEINGEELVYTGVDSGIYREYSSKIENGSFIRYRFYYIDNYWEITLPDGMKSYYGQGFKSKEIISLAGADGTYRWYNTKIKDVNGNYIEYIYFTNGGKVYLSSIKYTGNRQTGDKPLLEINFNYEEREDKYSNFISGRNITQGLRLKKIILPYYEIVLSYDYSQESYNSLLTKIEGVYNNEVKYENVFNYQSGDKFLTQDATTSLPGYFNDALTGDFNGDGKIDFLTWKYNNTSILINIYSYVELEIIIPTPGGPIKSTIKHFELINSLTISGAYSISYPKDYNGDGRTDIIVDTGNGNLYIYNSTGDNFIQDIAVPYMFDLNNTGDLNGDGLLDSVKPYSLFSCFTLSGGLSEICPPPAFRAVIGTDTGFSTTALWYSYDYEYMEQIIGGDFNGDGETDVLGVAPLDIDGNLEYIYFDYNSQSDSFIKKGSIQPSQYFNNINIGDFNGDGKDDMAGEKRNPPFSAPTLWTPAGIGDLGFYIGDFNGDGKDDLARYRNGVGLEVGLSRGKIINGKGFDSFQTWTPPGMEYLSFYYIGDFNGDGKDDLGRWRSGVGFAVLLSKKSQDGFRHPVLWTTAGKGELGWHIGDFNGDGKDDLGRWRSGVGFEVLLSKKSQDGFRHPVLWTTAGKGELGWHIGDFNGDGKDDLGRWGGNGFRVFISTGSSFQNAGIWSSVAGPGHTGYHIADYNGDGRADIGRWRPYGFGFEVFLSTGDSFTGLERWRKVLNKGDGIWPWYIGDYDGNGRMDIARWRSGVGVEVLLSRKRRIRLYVSLSDGSNFNDFLSWILIKHNSMYFNLYFNDFNSDGKIDCLSEEKSLDGSTIFVLNLSTGTELKEYDSLTVPYQFEKITVGEVNGDGLADILAERKDASGTYLHLYSFQGKYPDLLYETYSTGEQSFKLEYKPSTKYNNTILPMVKQTLSEVSVSDGRGNKYKMNYEYSGGVYIKTKKDFRGYRTFKIIDAVGMKSISYYLQGEFTKGHVYRQEMRDRYNDLYIASSMKWAEQDMGNGCRYVKLVERTNFNYNGTSDFIATRSGFEYDSYGNITAERFYGKLESGPEDDIYKVTEYFYNPSEYIVNKPKKIYLLKYPDTILRQWEFSYDDLQSGLGNKGNLTKVKYYFDGQNDPFIRFNYDSYGNLDTITDVKGYVTHLDYDSTYHTYLEKVYRIVNGIEYKIKRRYNYITGNLESIEDINNNILRYEYDDINRLIKIIGPNDISEFPTIEYEYHPKSNPPKSISRYRQKSGSNDLLEVYCYCDGMGRIIQKKTPYDDGTGTIQWVSTGLVKYDELGRLISAGHPILTSTPAYNLIPLKYPSFYQYDSIGRLTNIIYPDGSEIKRKYGLNWTLFIDANGERQKRLVDIFGRITNIVKYLKDDGTDIYKELAL